jgi:urease accessory protein UreH
VRVASGAILEYFPLPLIPFARVLYAQEIKIRSSLVASAWSLRSITRPDRSW